MQTYWLIYLFTKHSKKVNLPNILPTKHSHYTVNPHCTNYIAALYYIAVVLPSFNCTSCGHVDDHSCISDLTNNCEQLYIVHANHGLQVPNSHMVSCRAIA